MSAHERPSRRASATAASSRASAFLRACAAARISPSTSIGSRCSRSHTARAASVPLAGRRRERRCRGRTRDAAPGPQGTLRAPAPTAPDRSRMSDRNCSNGRNRSATASRQSLPTAAGRCRCPEQPCDCAPAVTHAQPHRRPDAGRPRRARSPHRRQRDPLSQITTGLNWRPECPRRTRWPSLPSHTSSRRLSATPRPSSGI